MVTGGPKARMVLYVSDGSPSCERTVRRVTRLLSQYRAEDYEFVVRNVSRDRLDSTRDPHKVVLTPTLVMDARDRHRIVGEVQDLADLDAKLEASGVRRVSRAGRVD